MREIQRSSLVFVAVTLLLLASTRGDLSAEPDSVLYIDEARNHEDSLTELPASLESILHGTMLLPNEGAVDDRFASALSLSGDRVLVGAKFDDQNGEDAGAAYILELSAGIWTQVAKLLPADGSPGDEFGRAVSFSGNRALVGAYGTDHPDGGDYAGSAYVFDLVDGEWVESAKLEPSDRTLNDRFGFSVSLSGDRALVGAHGSDGAWRDSGAAYVFDLVGGHWEQSARLLAAVAEDYDDRFGFSVALVGPRALVGAIGAGQPVGGYSGAVFAFELLGGVWTQVQELVASDGAPLDQFGMNLSLSDSRLMVGVPDEERNSFDQGAVYVFELVGGLWVEDAKLTASDAPLARGKFGRSVSFSGSFALIGARNYWGSDDDFGAVYVFELDQGTWIETDMLTASDATTGDHFGLRVSVSGDRVIVGAPTDDLDTHGADAGSAYVFDQSGGTWHESDKLTSLEGTLDDRFGHAVSLDGNRALVGAWSADDRGDDSGAAYIFELVAGSWHQVAKLVPSDGEIEDLFGNAVSLQADRALIGAFLDDDLGSEAGAAYLFERIDGEWTEVAKLTASDGAQWASFGCAVSLDGDRALVGAYKAEGNEPLSGAAYVFDLVGDAWVETQRLLASDGALWDDFGLSVSLDGDRAVIGAPGEHQGVYVFESSGPTWSETAKLVPSDLESAQEFGGSVSLDGSTALIGSSFDDDPVLAAGSAYLFEIVGGAWTETQKLLASDGETYRRFGSSVSLEGRLALVGAPGDSGSGENRGAAYLFERVAGSWGEVGKLSRAEGGDMLGDAVDLSGNLALVGDPRDDAAGTDSGSAQVFELPFFADGFESGDTNAWSSATP